MIGSKVFSTKREAIEDAKKTVLIVVVIASIIVSVGIVTTNFLYDLSRYKARVIGEKESAVAAINANLSAVDDLVNSFRAFEDGPDLISSQGDRQNSSVVLDSLPSKYDYPALATSMESLVKKSGLRLDSFNGQDETSSATQFAAIPQPEPIQFSLVLLGSYDDTQEFIVQLQRTIRAIYIDRIELTGSDENIRSEMTLRTFYQPSVSLDVQTKAVE